MLKASVLDLAPIVDGGSARQALLEAGELARTAERLGFHRYWMAEHHSMPGVASAATAVALAYVGAQTSTIRIGSGGIMLPNHAPLIVAEQFGTLESLFPGRVDLGLGRAPGTDQAAALALRRNLSTDERQFPRDVRELIGYFRGEGERVRAIPGEGLNVPITILGSSLFGARMAAEFGLPFAFASHFAPHLMMEAIDVYRSHFRSSEQLSEPYLMLGYNAFLADSDEEARILSTSVQQAFVALRRGRAVQLPPPDPDFTRNLSVQDRAVLEGIISCSATGSIDTARAQIGAFVSMAQPDEIIFTSQIYSRDARLRSFELLGEVVRSL